MDALIPAGIAIGAVSILLSCISVRQSRIRHGKPERFWHDAPLVLMYLVGTWILVPAGYLWAIGYVIFALVSNIWYMTMICPSCVYHGRADGESYLCALSGRLATKGDTAAFGVRFRRNIGVVIVGWILPLFGSGYLILQSYTDRMHLEYSIFMLASFCLVAFYLLPEATRPGCERCENAKNCPWRRSSRTGQPGGQT